MTRFKPFHIVVTCLLAFFLYSATCCCTMMTEAYAKPVQAPQPSCHGSHHADDSKQAPQSKDDCHCHAIKSTVAQQISLEDATHSAQFSNLPLSLDILTMDGYAMLVRQTDRSNSSPPLYIQHAVLRL